MSSRTSADRPRSPLGAVLIVGLALAGAITLGLQRYRAHILREEVGFLRAEEATLSELRTQNRRLADAQPSDEEIHRLRAEHAAVERLRREVADLQLRAAQMERSAPTFDVTTEVGDAARKK